MNITVQADKDFLKGVDHSVHQLVKNYLFKLMTNDANPSLHIEPMKDPIDSRVRTGRVNDFWRAVMFKITAQNQTFYYIYRVLAHDEANQLAPSVSFGVNSITGVPEFQLDIPPTPQPATAPTPTKTHTPQQQPPAPPFLSAWGATEERLRNELGFAPDVAALAMACTTDNDVIELAVTINGIHADMLLSLGAGKPISEVRNEFGLDDAKDFVTSLPDNPDTGQRDLHSDDAIVKASQTPLAKAQFTILDGEDELSRIIDTGDFGAWRTFLHPTQRTYVNAHYNGAARLSGGAGTGKTVVLLHRAARLHADNPTARILLTTFNKTLARNLTDNLHLLNPTLPIHDTPNHAGICVRGIDSLAATILQNANKNQRNELCQRLLGRSFTMNTQFMSDSIWHTAIETLPDTIDPRVATVSFLKTEYENVILPHLISDLAHYRTIKRPGRGIALNRAGRDAVWAAISAYKLNSENSLSFPERLALAAAFLTEHGEPMADHVLVDEGQDFSAVHWKLIRALVTPGPNDIYIADDANQRIYAQKIVLGHYGIPIVGRSRRLSLNYRTTQQNLRYALGVLEGAHFEDLEGSDVDTTSIISARFGPNPQLLTSTHLADATNKAVNVITQWFDSDNQQPQSVAVLLPKKTYADTLETAFKKHGLHATYVDEKTTVTDPGVIQLMTMHRSKGMEFSRVILFKQSGLLDESTINAMDLDDSEKKDLLLRNRSLVYVASTRARDELVIIN